MIRPVGRKMYHRVRRHHVPWLLVKNAAGLVEILRKPSSRPRLVVLCGPSHAGKSTFANALFGSFNIVSSERIRQRLGVNFDHSRPEPAVWKAFGKQKAAALRARLNVVLDACHLSPRARWHSVQGVAKRYEKAFVLFNPRLEQVLARSSSTGRLPPAEVERLWWVFQRNRPTRDELEALGFDSVYVMDQRAHLAGPLPRPDSSGPITSCGVPGGD